MHLVDFSVPEIKEQPNMPYALDNQSFPYKQISDSRRFEELLYSIYKLKIERREIIDYDSISLMGGIAEQGRDCVLFRQGKAYGVIQCKKLASNLSKDEFGKEITKLILYSLLDDRIINDPNDFTYYIAVAGDFTAECRSFIDDFNNQIAIEPNLDVWLSSNLKMPTLNSLAVGEYKVEVLTILSKIKIRKIVPQDLDLELSNKPELQSTFFTIRSLTDNTYAEKILNVLAGGLTEENVSKQLYNGSIGLISERNTFEGIPGSHIPRAETTQLVNWVQSQAKKDEEGKVQNICLLAAPAGFGKTVILRDFFMECSLLNIPTLGLKVDKLYSYTISDLQNSIGFTLPVFEFIERCIALFPLTVIVIDQIDALSQSMSSDRRFMDVFKGFIDRFENNPNIKIIISVRNQDLNYDPSLRQFREKHTIPVAKLSAEQVFEELKKIGITQNRVSSKLIELLRIPNNLNIFSRIAANEECFRVTTIEELYAELWNQKVLQISSNTKTNKIKVRDALYSIAEKMFKSQRITISTHQLEDFFDEVNYLESEQLVKCENKQLQFFHQSFYDFVFAKQFVENNFDLLSYIKESEQSIHIRSAVKMIVTYLRDFDQIKYENYISRIISEYDIFFHIKHIVFLTILFQSTPTCAEQNLTKLCLESSWNYRALFFENADGSIWMKFVIDNGLLGFLGDEIEKIELPKLGTGGESIDAAMLNLKVYFLQRQVVSNEKFAWQYFMQLDDTTIIQRILYFITDWSNINAFSMFTKCPDFVNSDPWSYYQTLNNIIKYDVNFVLNDLKKTLPQNYKKGNRKRDYDEREVLQSLAKIVPERLFLILYKSMKRGLFYKASCTSSGLILDWELSHTDLRDDEHLDGREFMYQLLALCLKKTALTHEIEFLKFFHAHKSSNYYSILRLLTFSLAGNENKFTHEIIDLFDHFSRLGLLTHRDDLEYDLRCIVQNGFPHMNGKQQNIILNKIRNYCDKSEIVVRGRQTENPAIYSVWGLAKYFWLLRIPREIIQDNPELRVSLLELQRRFPSEIDTPKKRSVLAGVVRSPIPADAHRFMRKKHWLKSFKTYKNDRDRWGKDFLKGGMSELSSAFQDAVTKDPSEEKLKIISTVVESPDIPIEYGISGLYGWACSDADSSVIVPIFEGLLERYYDDSDPYLRSVAGRLAGLENASSKIISFLVEKSLQFKVTVSDSNDVGDTSETSVRGLITKGINTRYGSAASSLTLVCDKGFKDEIFTTVKHILEHGPPESKASIYFRFYFLKKLDREEAHDLFVSSLNREKDVFVIASSIQSLQYFRSKGLKVLDTPYRLLINSGVLGREDSDYLFTILYGSYLHDQEGAKDLLEALINSNSCGRSKAIGDIIKYYYEVENSKLKNNALLDFVLAKVDEEEFDDISWNFYNAGHVELNDIYNFIDRFIRSKYFKLTSHFIEYLRTQCSKFPFMAIELFYSALVHDKSQLQHKAGYHLEEEGIKFIISAFKAITDTSAEAKSARKKLLSSFDKLITDFRYRTNQERILSELI